MSRLPLVDPANATGKTKELLDQVQKNMGTVINIVKALANSPALLQAYLGFSAPLKNGVLDVKIREQIALVVGEATGCDYCIAAHTAIGKKSGLTDDEIRDARLAKANDPKAQAAISFSSAMIGKEGYVSDEDLAELRSAGYSEEEVAEVIGNVLLNLFTNYFNHVAEPEIDFPAVEAVK
jgi:uncharacterized peroxidase-related enzyme